MTYATPQEVQLAYYLGYDHDVNQQRGHRFVKGRRHVWAARRYTDDGFTLCWQTADLKGGRFQGHHKYDDLADALRRP